MSYVIKPVAKQITDILANSGVFIAPKDNSVISPIVDQLVTPIDLSDVASTEALVDKTNQYISDRTPNPFAKVSLEEVSLGNPFEVVNNATYDELRAPVVKIFENLRVIVPIIKNIFDKAYEATSDVIQSGGIKATIKTDGSEQMLWSNPALKTLLNRATETSTNGYLSTVTLPHFTIEQLNGLIKTGNEFLDNEISEAFKGCNLNEALEHTFHKYFNVAANYQHKFTDKKLTHLIAFLFASNLLAECPDGVSGVDSSEYDAMMTRMINFHGVALRNELKREEVMYSTRSLIVGMISDSELLDESQAVIVNGKLYKEFLAAGGEADAIFGSVVSTRARSMDVLLENNSMLVSKWVNFVATMQSSQRDRFQTKFLFELRRAIIQHANDNGTTYNKDALQETYEHISKLTEDNVFAYARKVIIKALFPNNGDYLTILKNIDYITEKNDGIEFEEALELATIDWIVEWLLTHVKVN